MNIFTKFVTLKLCLILSLFVLSSNYVMAQSDKNTMADVQKARAMLRHGGNHKQFTAPTTEAEKFYGVFYGYLPCEHCAGIKTTLSLKNKHNYLVVIQYAQASNKEFYEKGKYVWDEKSSTLTLTSRKDGKVSKYYIKDETTLVQYNPNGKRRLRKLKEYSLIRADAKYSREVHIH